MAAQLETLSVVQSVHDTVRVVMRDTVVRVAEPASSDAAAASRDIPGIVTAVAVTVTAVLALWVFVRDRIPPKIAIDYDFDAYGSRLRHSHYGALPPNDEHCTLVTVHNRAAKAIFVERVEVEFTVENKREFIPLRGGKEGPLDPGATRYWFLYRDFAEDCMKKGGRFITVVVRGRKPYLLPLEPAARRTS